MSLTGEGTTPEKPTLKADRDSVFRTYHNLEWLLTYPGAAHSSDFQAAKAKRGQEIRGDAYRLAQAGKEADARVIDIMGLAIEASQTERQGDRIGAMNDLVNRGLLSSGQAYEFAGFVESLQALRREGARGNVVMDVMHGILDRVDPNLTVNGELELAMFTSAAWSMNDLAYAQDAYHLIERSFVTDETTIS